MGFVEGIQIKELVKLYEYTKNDKFGVFFLLIGEVK